MDDGCCQWFLARWAEEAGDRLFEETLVDECIKLQDLPLVLREIWNCGGQPMHHYMIEMHC